MLFKNFFSKKKKIDIELLKVDIHSHLIPGIDDGAANIEESLELIKEMYLLGYRHLYITPHIMEDYYNNKTKDILALFYNLKKELRNRDINISISIGAEYYLDNELKRRLKNKDLLLIDNKFLLFETSLYYEPLNLLDFIFDIKAKGYVPILAHPERYKYIENFDFYEKLKTIGVYFQVNINSFGGFYGKSSQKKAIYLSNKGFIDFLGSDLHKKKQVMFLKNVLKNKIFYDILSKNNILNNKLTN